MPISFSESSPESAKDALLSVLNKSGDMDFDFGEDTLQTFKHPTKTLPSDPLRILDPLRGLDIYRNADMSILASRGSQLGLYNIGYTIEEQAVDDQNNTQSDMKFASSPKTDTDTEEVSEELNWLAQNNRSNSHVDNSGRKYSKDSDNRHQPHSKKQHDQLISPDPETNSQQNDPHSGQTIKTHSLSCDSGLSTLPSSVESSQQMSSAKATQSTKKLTHYRSMSDYGLPHKAILEDVTSEGKSSESTSLSSSLPTTQKGKVHVSRPRE